ncbi:MAG: hypothetical protein PWR27_1689 [Petroclostridium sp.]|jgi:hypothetical protein|nr:hypothetical protein [Clostridia bacterium]MDK2810980.1 hypothetical protein [Petroclostridium sp.]
MTVGQITVLVLVGFFIIGGFYLIHVASKLSDKDSEKR